MKNNELTKSIYSSLDDIFDDTFADAKSEVWTENPVSFHMFVESPDHMNLPPLSERQYAVADFMFGDDSKKIFDNKNTLAVLVLGKGSGKDYMAALMLCYIVYVLLCMASPQKFFGFPEGEPIDLLNVAVNAEQANSIFFEKLRQRVLRWQWLRDKYPIKMSGIFLGQLKAEDFFNYVVVTKNGIMFPKMIRAFSGHSEEGSQEGKNLLCWIGDEISAFDETPTTSRAQKIFDMLRTSASSRFGQRWKGFCLSFPRYDNDFILKLYEIAQGELHWYADKAATWEVKPAHLFKDYPQKYFEYHGYKIPLEFEQDFKLDPQDALGKFCCEPVSISSAFIDQSEKVDWSIDRSRVPLVDTEEYYEGTEVRKRILAFKLDSVPRQYVIACDLGLKSDSAALSLFHKEHINNTDQYIQDYVGVWKPDKSKGIIVSLTDVENFIKQLAGKISITQVWFDQWNSQLMVQQLNEAGIASQVYYLKFQDYKNFKENLYLGTVRLLNFEPQVRELKKLVLTKASRVDHPSGESKDIADTIVGCCKILSPMAAGNGSVSGLGGTYIESENVVSQGGHFI